MTIEQALKNAIKKLQTKKITSAALDAEVLLSFVLKKPKEYLYTYPEKKLTKPQLKKFNQLVACRARLKPVAYLTGQKEFYGLSFFVSKNVLIPRPESELIIGEVLKFFKSEICNLKSEIHICDVGAGSGCLAVALAKQLSLSPGGRGTKSEGEIKIYATDISAKALTVARKNARLHNVKIAFLKGNLLIPLKSINPEIIIANLPYLTKKQTKNKNLKYEPKTALDGGKDGLKFYKKLFQQINKFNLTPKLIIIEIDPAQAVKIKKIIKLSPSNYIAKTVKDCSQNNRIIIITLHKFMRLSASRRHEFLRE